MTPALRPAGQRRAPAQGVQRQAKAEIARPVFDYKSHLVIDRRQGFIRHLVVTNATRYDRVQLGAVLNPDRTGDVWPG